MLDSIFFTALCAAGITKSLFIAEPNVYLARDSSGIKMPAELEKLDENYRRSHYTGDCSVAVCCQYQNGQ